MPDLQSLLDRIAQSAVEQNTGIDATDPWFNVYAGDFGEARTAIIEAGVSQVEANRLTACMALARHQIAAEQRESAGQPVTRATTNAINYLEKFV